ncbi:hypothetical protein Z949_2308 [Sulfitobacter guttiformis KCTC 32187]|nr:hypothetical protein Z949_2308 [Sulfitobacter guttiformis KCTC 32187]
MGGVNVEKAQFVRASGVICDGCIDGVTRIAQADKIYTFDHTAVGDIETGDDACFKHETGLAVGEAWGKVALGVKALVLFVHIF